VDAVIPKRGRGRLSEEGLEGLTGRVWIRGGTIRQTVSMAPCPIATKVLTANATYGPVRIEYVRQRDLDAFTRTRVSRTKKQLWWLSRLKASNKGLFVFTVRQWDAKKESAAQELVIPPSAAQFCISENFLRQVVLPEGDAVEQLDQSKPGSRHRAMVQFSTLRAGGDSVREFGGGYRSKPPVANFFLKISNFHRVIARRKARSAYANGDYSDPDEVGLTAQLLLYQGKKEVKPTDLPNLPEEESVSAKEVTAKLHEELRDMQRHLANCGDDSVTHTDETSYPRGNFSLYVTDMVNLMTNPDVKKFVNTVAEDFDSTADDIHVELTGRDEPVADIINQVLKVDEESFPPEK